MDMASSPSAAGAVLGGPVTRRELGAELRELGVREGGVLLVHASLSTLNWVCGGPVAVVQALRDALGSTGTLVVPTHTPDNSDPAGWQHPPVPAGWWPVIRAEMPAFDPPVTPSRYMGAVAEAVRTWPGARRSDHPQGSFAALGPAAEWVTAGHARAEMFGERSPLGRVYEADGQVLLLGVGHDSNTSLHLAEYRVPDQPRRLRGAAVLTPAGREWASWADVDVDAADFAALGRDLEATGAVRTGRVGGAAARLVRQRDAVDFAAGWLPRHRRGHGR
jgi:aminoglycoside 3-N-acetyltransferase